MYRRQYRRSCDTSTQTHIENFPAQVQRAIDAGHDRKAADVVVLDLRLPTGSPITLSS